ncbi:TlpA disulfide reductase family protein [uncultured Rothia sp.]|uniref:TlpA family protein disulfide reductase n=1 Tax=uncultured Rothia sp. TaxID=316088 RepID=UPI0032165258
MPANLKHEESQRFSRKQVLSFAGVATALFLTGCSDNDSLADQADAGDSKGYIAGDGSVTEYAENERGESVVFTGTKYDGTQVTSEDLKGQPVLLNFWYAGCAPCRAEAPHLVKLHQKFEKSVHFFGVNVRDEKGTAEAFENNFNIDYPSFKDTDGKVLYDLSKYVPAQAVPTTLILDAQGRVAARILGEIDESILSTLIDDQVKSV